MACCSNANEVCIVATMECHDEAKRAELMALFLKGNVLATIRAEDGCISYLPSIDVDSKFSKARPTVLTVVEHWKSLAHVETHLQTAHMVEFFKASQPLIKDSKIQVLSPLHKC
eukprot:TRINITY_DN18119_c0_g1_i1.p2 TRINITY_DN18119_c0_g1~~TRINITY_DN18119_c0_g1_i1.p2  ORF type:complete len:114 (-),score=32.13 TRINITY_DN18119_c0_g1_i1:38-379(-)